MIIFKGVLKFFLYYTIPLPNNNDNPVDRTQHTHTQVNILKAIKPTSWVPSSHSLFVIWYATKERWLLTRLASYATNTTRKYSTSF